MLKAASVEKSAPNDGREEKERRGHVSHTPVSAGHGAPETTLTWLRCLVVSVYHLIRLKDRKTFLPFLRSEN